MDKLKTFEELQLEEDLCYKLDENLYLPVKEELKGCGRAYSLGIRKEIFKGDIAGAFQKLKQEAIKWINHSWKQAKEMFPEITKEGLEIQGKDFMEFFNITEEELK